MELIIKNANRPFENMANFKYKEMTVTKREDIHKEINRFSSENV
jgi:hypothetical protein